MSAKPSESVPENASLDTSAEPTPETTPADDRIADSDPLGDVEPASILNIMIPDFTAWQVIHAMYGTDDNIPGLPGVLFDVDTIVAITKSLRGIYSVAYIEHSLGSRELSTELDKLLDGLLRSKVETVEEWTAAEVFDRFTDLFQAAAFDIWKQSKRTIDFRDFRVELDQPGPSSLRALQALARHLQQTKDAFENIRPPEFIIKVSKETNQYQRDLLVMYYKYFRPRNDQFPDKTIIRQLAELYEAIFDVKFSLSEEKVELRKDRSDRHIWNGPSIRFACAAIREVGLYRFMAPLDRTAAKARPNPTPSVFPKHRSYDDEGRIDNSIDLSHPFPWEVPKDEKGRRPLLPNNDWEKMKIRIKDAWENK